MRKVHVFQHLPKHEALLDVLLPEERPVGLLPVSKGRSRIADLPE
jgi:hypothetical protein